MSAHDVDVVSVVDARQLKGKIVRTVRGEARAVYKEYENGHVPSFNGYGHIPCMLRRLAKIPLFASYSVKIP